MRRITRTSRKLALLALTAALVVVGSGSAFGGGIERVFVDGNRWDRKHEYINRGERVRWVNNSNRFHNIRSTNIQQNWNYSRNLPAGERVTRRFRRSGTFIYRCSIHSQIVQGSCEGMCGFIHVD
jgi:plastocyanin